MERIGIGLYALTLALAVPQTTSGQVPDEFTNLRFFPQDISQQELVGHMRGFSMATGLRCTGCHVGQEGQPFSTYDFASDEKLLKRRARSMLVMTRDINDGHLARLAGRGADGLRVTCATCHGGVRRPVPITTIVAETIAEDGVDAAVSEYRRLRARYHGTRAYDFGERPLIELAQTLARSGKVQSGVALLHQNTEYFEQSDESYVTLGEIHRLDGDTVEAVAAYRRALEINPQNAAAQRRIRELGT
jgi:hypothetical protein